MFSETNNVAFQLIMFFLTVAKLCRHFQLRKTWPRCCYIALACFVSQSPEQTWAASQF